MTHVGTKNASIDWRTITMLCPLAFVALFSPLASAAVHDGAAGLSAAPAIAAPTAPQTSDLSRAVDVDHVVDSVEHAIEPDAARAGTFQVPGAGYAATFDAAGLEVDGLGVSVRAIARNGAPALDLRPGTWVPDANVAERPLTPVVTERVTASASGVQWDVVLDERPTGAGDLAVEAKLTGLRPGGSAERVGATWVLPVAGGREVTIDELVVLDAAGAELHRALPTIVDDVLRLTVPAAVVDGAAYPLTLDPTVAPERLVSAQSAPNNQETPAIAFGNGNFLVVWETRSGGIYGTRVTPGGTVLDTPAIEIDFFGPTDPAISFDGTNFLVVFEDYDNIGGRIVSPAGVVGEAIVITAATGAQSNPDVVFNGSSHVVVWDDQRSGAADIYSARVTTAGTVLDPAGLVVSNATGAQNRPAVAYDGTNSVVVWSDARSGTTDIFGARVGPGGGVSDPAGIPISTATDSQTSPDISFDGTNHLVVWTDWRSGDTDIYGTRVSPAGGVLSANGFAISTAADSQDRPVVAHDGASHLVVWEDERSAVNQVEVYATRVTNAGVVVTPTGTPVSTKGQFSLDPAVAAGGGTFFAAWEDTRFGDDAFGARISPAGAVLDGGLLLSGVLAGSGQSQPVVAFDGTNFLVVWSEFRAGNLDIYGTRVAPGGRVLDPNGFPISTAANDQLQPAVAFGGGEFLVTWTDRRSGNDDLYLTKVSTAGVVQSPSGVPLSTGTPFANESAIAWNGSRFLVVWADNRGAPVTSTIYAARVNAAGVQDPSGIQLSPTAGLEYTPTVAAGGSTFMVAWTDYRSSSAGAQIFANRVTDAGTPVAPGEFLVASRDGGQSDPAIAFDGTNFFVVYVQQAGSGVRDLYGTRVSQAAAVLDGVTTGKAVSTVAGNQSLPQIAFNATFLVIWTQRNGAGQDEMYGVRVGTDGNNRDATPFPVASGGASTGSFPERAAGITKGPNGEWGVVHDRGFAGIYLRAVSPK